jgi:hypothetical protein
MGFAFGDFATQSDGPGHRARCWFWRQTQPEDGDRILTAPPQLLAWAGVSRHWHYR